MKQAQSEKYNIAWFKLAECVARGEKERALGVFRLLSHSFEDSAFAQQLEGDIFLVFKENENAKKKYITAAQLYQEGGRMLQATAVYEHLLSLDSRAVEYRKKLLDLYIAQKINYKAIIQANALVEQLVAQKTLEKAGQVLSELENRLQPVDLGSIYEKLIFLLVHNNSIPQEILILHGKKTVDILSGLSDNQKLQQFLAKLEPLSKSVHDELIKHLAQNS